MKRAVFGLLLTLVPAFGGDWAQWRGPAFNGSSTEKGLPSQWSRDNVTWQVDLPGPSAATPIIFGDKVFISTADSSTKTLHALCFDRNSGKLLWNQKTGDGMGRD